MINGLINGIVRALNKEFNAESDTYEIYKEEIKQGLQEPAFFVQSINPSMNLFLGKRYFQQAHILIQYFPKSTNYLEECSNMGDQLPWVIEWITCDGDSKPLHGYNMHSELVDGVLNFFVDYEFFIRKIENPDLMESMNLKQNVRKGAS